jgi:hypothetical protein
MITDRMHLEVSELLKMVTLGFLFAKRRHSLGINHFTQLRRSLSPLLLTGINVVYTVQLLDSQCVLSLLCLLR